MSANAQSAGAAVARVPLELVGARPPWRAPSTPPQLVSVPQIPRDRVTPTVYVVDDDETLLKSLELLIRSIGLRVETYASAQEFLAAYDHARPGCLLLDVRMPGMSGLELQRHLRGRTDGPPVIIVTGYGDVPIAVRAMKDGALEFLEKPFSPQVLLELVQDAIKQDSARRVAENRRCQIVALLALLTPREREVMDLVVAGRASKEVAAALGISKKTVDVHRGRVMHKLQVATVPELVKLAITARPAALAEVQEFSA